MGPTGFPVCVETSTTGKDSSIEGNKLQYNITTKVGSKEKRWLVQSNPRDEGAGVSFAFVHQSRCVFIWSSSINQSKNDRDQKIGAHTPLEHDRQPEYFDVSPLYKKKKKKKKNNSNFDNLWGFGIHIR